MGEKDFQEILKEGTQMANKHKKKMFKVISH